MAQSKLSYVDELLDNLVRSEEWPCGIGKIIFNSADSVRMQMDTYALWLIGKSVPQIADQQGITLVAARDRIEKIRNYIAESLMGGHKLADRIKAASLLMQYGEESSRAMRMMMLKIQN